MAYINLKVKTDKAAGDLLYVEAWKRGYWYDRRGDAVKRVAKLQIPMGMMVRCRTEVGVRVLTVKDLTESRLKVSDNDKARASGVYVLAIYDCQKRFDKRRDKTVYATILKPLPPNRAAMYSAYDKRFVYHAGHLNDAMRPACGFSLSGKECASGIHFFFSRKAAENY